MALDIVPPDLGRAAFAKSYAVLTLAGVAAVDVLVEEVESVSCRIPAVEVVPDTAVIVTLVEPL
jgi:hypothetical protein